LLSVSILQIYHVWAGNDGAWLVLVGVIVAPLALVAYASLTWWHMPGTVAARGTATHLVGASLIAPFRTHCSWFGCVWLVDRLAFSTLLVVASEHALLQVLLVRQQVSLLALRCVERERSTCAVLCGV
jgi:hypothetical protein